jgi:hypothetical protein
MTNPGSSQRDGLRETPPRGERRVVVHLLAADGLLSPERGLRLPRVYWTVCGEEVADSDLPQAVCPEECDCEQYYCPACLRQATVRNAETDARIAAAAGILREEPGCAPRRVHRRPRACCLRPRILPPVGSRVGSGTVRPAASVWAGLSGVSGAAEVLNGDDDVSAHPA